MRRRRSPPQWCRGIMVVLLCLVSPAMSEVVFTHPDYVLSFHEAGRVAHMQLSAAEYARWSNAAPTSADRSNLTWRLYSHLEDRFDFIMIINDEAQPSGGTYGRNYPIRNDVSGIGRSLFDYSASYGSTGVLRSLIHLTLRDGLADGPSLHEIAHQWGQYLTSVPTASASHWGYSSAGGQLGGWQHGTLQDLGGGQYDADGPGGVTYWFANANGGNSVPYSDLELYLMGLIPTNLVTNSLIVAQGFAWTDMGEGRFSATGLLNITIGDIVATDGARVPACGTSPTNFRAVVVVISAGPLPANRWADMDEDVAAFSTNGSEGVDSVYNFWEATRGLAQIKMDGLTALFRAGSEYVTVSGTQTLDAVTYRGDIPSVSNTLFTLTNTYAVPLVWTTSVSAAWLTASPASGLLPAGGSTQVLVSINEAARSLAGGAYAAEVRFINASNSAATVRHASLAVYDFAEPPFSDGFESGALSPYWVATGTGEWHIVVTATNSVPHSGTYHLGLDDYAGLSGVYFSRNEATLGLDLDGYSNVVLTFWAQDTGDESHGPPPAPFVGGADFDGVAISADGTNWYEVQGLRGLPEYTYTQLVVNLDAAVAAHGLTYNRRFRVRFNQFDNYPIGLGDGITIDDVSVTATLMDSDTDGMPDRYERQYGLNPTNAADAAEDRDNDGVSNLGEYIADTSPTSEVSVLKITTFTQTNSVAVRFESSSRRSYTLLQSGTLQPAAWIDVPGAVNQPGSGGAMTLTDTNATAPSARFYSVQCSIP